MIDNRLNDHGFHPDTTFSESIESLRKIQDLAAATKGECRSIAEITGFDSEPGLERAQKFFESHDPNPQ
jgi:hypothetical protein